MCWPPKCKWHHKHLPNRVSHAQGAARWCCTSAATSAAGSTAAAWSAPRTGTPASGAPCIHCQIFGGAHAVGRYGRRRSLHEPAMSDQSACEAPLACVHRRTRQSHKRTVCVQFSLKTGDCLSRQLENLYCPRSCGGSACRVAACASAHRGARSVEWDEPYGGECTDVFVLGVGGFSLTQLSDMTIRGSGHRCKYRRVRGPGSPITSIHG